MVFVHKNPDEIVISNMNKQATMTTTETTITKSVHKKTLKTELPLLTDTHTDRRRYHKYRVTSSLVAGKRYVLQCYYWYYY